MSTVATVPDSRFIATGVPNRLENRPRALGPPPSKHATASVRSAPMIHVAPALASAKTNTRAVIRPSSSPVPVSVAVPPVTCPPYTVNTALAASRNPVSPVT